MFKKEFKGKIDLMIKGKVGKLGNSIDDLYDKFLDLYNTLDKLDYNLELLPHRINRIRNTVQTSIVNLNEHITKGVQSNKNKINQTVDAIDKKISGTDDILKEYKEIQVLKINLSQFKIHLLQLTIPYKVNTISFNIRRIMCLIALSRKITHTLKVGERTISNTIKDDSGYSHAVYYEIESSETFEEFDEIKQIVQSLQGISAIIQKLQPLILTSLNNLKPEDLVNIDSYLQKITPIQQHLQSLEDTMLKFQKLKQDLHEQIKKLTEQCDTEKIENFGYNSQQFSEQKQGTGATSSQKSEYFSTYGFTISKTIVTCNEEILKHLEEVDKEISKLHENIKTYTQNYEDITQELEELKTMIKLLLGLNYIECLNSELNKSIFKSNNINEIIEKLVSAKTIEDNIQKIINKICRSRYLVYVFLMKIVVKYLLSLTEKQYPKGTNLFNLYLNSTRRALYFIKCRLTELLRLRENIIYLYYPILGIRQLQDFQKEKIKELQQHKEKLNPFMVTLDPYLKVLDKIGCRIEKIYDLKDKLPKLEVPSKLPNLENMPENLKTISYHYTWIVRLNLVLQGLKGGEFLESLKEVGGVGGVQGGNLSNGLQQIKDKLSKVTESNFENITEKFKDKVQRILSQCSIRLKRIGETKFDQNSFRKNITTCITHANRLIVFSNSNTCKELDELKVPCLRESLNVIDTCVKCVTTLCKPDKVCGPITAAIAKIKSSSDTKEILQCFDNCINALDSKLKEINQTFEKVKSSMESIENEKAKVQLVRLKVSIKKVKFTVDCLQLHLPKVTTDIVPFLDKVSGVICTLGKEIEHLQSQLETTRKELGILLDFKRGVNEAIRFIEEIKTQGTKITTLYSAYTAAFTAFKKALEDLETCLDFLIRDFLSCSLCTTICNLKRQIVDTTWECPDTDCNSCLRQSLLGDTVTKVEQQLYRYSWLVLGHSSTLEYKLLVSRLYEYCEKFYKIFCIIKKLNSCCCVCTFTPEKRYYGYRMLYEFLKKNLIIKSKLYEEHIVDNQRNHVCLCLTINYMLYPNFRKCLMVLVAIELDISGTIIRHMANYTSLNGYCGYHGYKGQLCVLLMLAICVYEKLSECINKRYICICKSESNCCCKPSDKPEGDKGDPANAANNVTPCKEDCTACKLRLKPCCDCHNSKDSKGCTPEKCGSKCKCEKGKEDDKPCPCKTPDKCRCYICFCCYWDDSLYPWFISVIVWMAWLLDNVFTLSHSDLQHSIQLLSNLWTELDEMCCHAHNKPTPTDKTTLPSPSCSSPVLPPTPTLKVRCCLVCINVKVVCVSTHVLFITHVLVKSFNNQDGKKEEFNPETIVCFCKCESAEKCLEQLTKLDVNNITLKCELFKGLKDKLTELKNVNGDTPPPKWTIVCDCKPEQCKCLCKDEKKDLAEVCTKLKVDFKDFETEDFNCGCESVKQCCCCCKCDECGTGKKRKCNEKGCGHANGHGNDSAQGTSATPSQPSGSQPAGHGNGTTEQAKCPCQEGKDKKDGEKKCCCNKDKDGKNGKKCCNCTEGKDAKPAKTPCQCCCLSCCADEKNEDKPEGEPTQPQQQPQDQQSNGDKNCPCKKKKKKDKPKKHCKDDDNLKDKRCCCKCRPKENEGEGANNNSNGATPNPNKECCCCCKCKTKCGKKAAAAAGGGGTSGGSGVSAGGSNNCNCPNGKDNKEEANSHNKCRCYCCFECEHKKSALRSVCKQFAHELNSSILVLSNLPLRVVVTTFVCISKMMYVLVSLLVRGSECLPQSVISFGQLL